MVVWSPGSMDGKARQARLGLATRYGYDAIGDSEVKSAMMRTLCEML